MHQNQYGGSIGGPSPRPDVFLLERRAQHLDQSGLVTILRTRLRAINGRLAAVGYTGPAVSTGLYPNPVDTTHFLVKVDHHLGPASPVASLQQLRVRANARGAGGTSAPSASAGLDNLDQSIAVGSVMVLSTGTVLETRGQFARGDLEAPPTDPWVRPSALPASRPSARSRASPTGRLSRT